MVARAVSGASLPTEEEEEEPKDQREDAPASLREEPGERPAEEVPIFPETAAWQELARTEATAAPRAAQAEARAVSAALRA